MLKSICTFTCLMFSVSVSLAAEAPPFQSIDWNNLKIGALSVDSNAPVVPDVGADDKEIPEYDQDCHASAYTVTLFKTCKGENQKRLWRQSKIVGVGALGVAGVLLLLPEDISKWDKSNWGEGQLFSRWWENVRSGPVWDNDLPIVNYVGHPYFGSIYYQVARKSGYNQWNSVSYAALMSTFFWEYGVEAFAEIPSVQDLVVTPLGGWIWGEWAYHKEQELQANGGLAMGSKFWGNVAFFFLDPVGTIDGWLGNKDVAVASLNFSHRPAIYSENGVVSRKDSWEIRVALTF
jgi:hypothetical protein